MLRKKAKQFLAGLCVAVMLVESVYTDGLIVRAAETDSEIVTEDVVMEDIADIVVSDGDIVAIEESEEVTQDQDVVEVTEEELESEEAGMADTEPEGGKFGPDNPDVEVVPDGHGGYDVLAASVTGGMGDFGHMDANGVLTIYAGWSGVSYNLLKGWDKVTEVYFESGDESCKFIGSSAFKNCVNLKRVDLTNCGKLTEINPEAFSGCTALEEVIFPTVLQKIETNAFKGCTSLKGVVLNSGLTELQSSAFEGCSSLKSVRVEAANLRCVNASGADASRIFKGCSIETFELAYQASENTEGKNIIVPNNLFNEATFAEDVTITIPNNIQEIGTKAFFKSNLKNIVFQDEKSKPSALSAIGNGAFGSCTSLESITFPSAVQSIGDTAFSGCTAITALEIPNTVTKIGKEAFKGCTGINDLTLSNATQKVNVGASIFEGCTGLTAVEIPAGLNYVGEKEFLGCTSLVDVVIPESVNEIGASAFEGCTAIVEIELPAAITEIKSKTFYGCSALKYADLPEGVTSVGTSAFEGCTHLLSNDLPESLTKIETKAYLGCMAFTSIVIPKNITELGAYVFMSCKNIKRVDLQAHGITKCGAGSFADCLLDVVIFPEGIETIPTYLFNQAGFSTNTVITIPATVTTIGAYAFGGSKQYPVTAVGFEFEKGSKLTTIGANAFQFCTAIEGFDIPETVTSIGASAFANCEKLGSIVIPENVTSIGKSAFSDCAVLADISYNAIAVTTSNEDIFKNCNVKSIVIGSNVVNFPAKLFKGAKFSKNPATNVEEPLTLNIPKSVKEIGEYALPNITNLEKVIFAKGSELTTVGAYAFSQCSNMTVCNLPDGVTTIGNNAFEGCTKLGTDSQIAFKMPANLTQLGSNAFANCTGITEVTIGGFLTDKWASATAKNPSTAALDKTFKGDNNLVTVEFNGASFIWIGESAFEGCSKIETIAIPNGVKAIKQYAFKDCTALNDVTIPATVEEIHKDAFAGCGNITFHVVPGSYAEEWLKGKGIDADLMIPIHYELNGGQSDGGNPAGYQIGDTTVLLPALRNGYDFVGWYTDATLNNEIKNLSGCTEELTLYAKWSIKTFSITYVLDGGVNNSGNITSYTPEDKFTFKHPTKEGFAFEGWFTNLLDSKSAVTEIKEGTYGDLILYAKWVGGTTYAPVASVVSHSEILPGTKVFLTCKTPGATIFYTLDGSEPTADSEVYVEGIVIDEETEIHAFAVKAGCDPSAVVTFVYTMADPGEAWGDISEADREQFDDATDVPEGIWVAGVPASVTYTGSPITFTNLRVYDGKKLLKEKTDYTVKYSNNKVAAGLTSKKVPTITITAKGNYASKDIVNFTINPCPINSGFITAADLEAVANGKDQKPVPVVMNGKTKLKVKSDFTVEYPAGGCVAAGKYTLKIVAKEGGNYTGSRTVSFNLVEGGSVAKAKVTGIPKSVAYDGKAATPKPVVEVNKVPLKEGTDYSLEYKNNTDAGTASVIIKGMKKYCGTKTVTFKIAPVAMLNKAQITLSETSVPYTGKPVIVGVTATYMGSNLTYNKDYTITYDKNTDAGTASVLITGKGGYSGTVKKTFKITPIDIATTDAFLLDDQGRTSDGNYAYSLSGVTPKVRVITKSSVLLSENQDYTLSYENNAALTSTKNGDTAVIIKGKKNFKGSKKVTFKIVKCDIEGFTIKASDVAFKNEAGVVNSCVVTVTDKSGKKLTSGTDFNVKYTYVNGTRTADGKNFRKAGDAVGKDDIVPAGTLICAKVSGTKNYTSSSKTADYTAIFRVYKKSISSAKVTVKPQIYTGYEIQPGLDDITSITIGGVSMKKGDYQIVGYSNNIKKGTGKMIIAGVGEYGGTKEVTFKINQKPFVIDSVLDFFR